MPRKILVFDTRSQFTVDIPDDAKITFGPSIPFSARPTPGRAVFASEGSRDHTYSLRIYKGSKENLLAVFPGVTGFRDMQLNIQEYDREATPGHELEMSETGRDTEEAPRPRRRRNRRTPNTGVNVPVDPSSVPQWGESLMEEPFLAPTQGTPAPSDAAINYTSIASAGTGGASRG